MKELLINKIRSLNTEERHLLLYKLKMQLNEPESPSTEKPMQLVAFIKPKKNFNIDSLRTYLKEQLPTYMIPSTIQLVDDFPYLPNGKIDKVALSTLKYRAEDKSSDQPLESSEIEKKLIAIWEQVLDFSPVLPDDNFFEIGGDSMLSIKLFWLIEKELNTKLPPTTLLNNPTISAVARRIENFNLANRKNFEYLVPFKEKGNKSPLFCIHGGEGHVLFYKSLPEFIDEKRPVYFVQPKGIDGVSPMHNSIEEMSKQYLDEILAIQPDGPYNLVFYCCSALVVEMSKQLSILNKQSKLIVVDSSPKLIQAEQKISRKDKNRLYLARLSKYPWKTLKSSLKYRYQHYIEPIYIKYSQDKVAKRLQRIRLHLRKVQNQYEWGKFETKITLILAAREHPDIMKRGRDSWNYWCTPGAKVIVTPGDHFSIFKKPYVKKLGENIEAECL